MTSDTDRGSLDASPPPLKFARREAVFVLSLWLFTLLYTVGYCYLFGYVKHTPPPRVLGFTIDLSRFDRSPADLHLIFGVPDWMFWGVLAPWFVCWVLTTWFSFFFFKDEDLGEDLFGIEEQLGE